MTQGDLDLKSQEPCVDSCGIGSTPGREGRASASPLFCSEVLFRGLRVRWSSRPSFVYCRVFSRTCLAGQVRLGGSFDRPSTPFNLVVLGISNGSGLHKLQERQEPSAKPSVMGGVLHGKTILRLKRGAFPSTCLVEDTKKGD